MGAVRNMLTRADVGVRVDRSEIDGWIEAVMLIDRPEPPYHTWEAVRLPTYQPGEIVLCSYGQDDLEYLGILADPEYSGDNCEVVVEALLEHYNEHGPHNYMIDPPLAPEGHWN